MASLTEIIPEAEFRKELQARAPTVGRCYQCATCSSVCELAPAEAPFPRRQMLWAQWGLGERLLADPSVWLCHQCNDCSARCPRDARPGDVLQAARALLVEKLAVPGILGRWVGKAQVTWPLLLGIPLLFWVIVLSAIHGLKIPEAPLVYDQFVPHWLIYLVFFSVTGLVLLATIASAARFWALLGQQNPRQGSFWANLWPVLWEIATHKRFGKCGEARPRRWGHFALLWGFVGAALASALIIVAMYILKEPLPLPLLHPFKIIGNVAAVLLVGGGVLLLVNRLRGGHRAGQTTGFDSFFLAVVLLVIVTGVLVELGRFVMSPGLACTLYIVHLGSVLTLFLTFPYSKFAHLIYRTLALVHERMAAPRKVS
jgi:quinone-modifying oxidoreductase subunit QmoC